MSDTSITSTSSSYKIQRANNDSSCCAQYWFRIISTCLSLIIIITSILLVHFIKEQTERDRKRQRAKDEFKRKHKIANKVVDMIMNDGIVNKWIKAQKGSIATLFKELFTDISETLFDE